MTQGHDDFAFEAAPGLPAPLPRGERLLWQGRPQWTALALSAFRLRGVAIYFLLVGAWRAASVWANGGSAGDIVAAAVWITLLAAITLAILSTLAWFYARTTVYSLTSKRLLIRSGIALPITLDIPLSLVETAAVRSAPLGTSSISFVIARPNRIAWLALWPHATPFAFNHPQPMLRAIADAPAVAPLIAEAMAATGQGTVGPAARLPGRASAASSASPGPIGLPA
ncbi:photosynthetic complex putative assembly protein PuhB [Aquibium microcysteis]|uniref:photosynthetic complex putative assembly protein PuhB n=1 Tax=Aquibium microcysteis TaxID=675281 RepID=UPI00165D1885|nr:photosynthetic complex putative assembly protein PuhB [Aquibium microcysteis]